MTVEAEPLLLWRKWRVKEGDFRLQSVFQETYWPPGERFEAKCRTNERPMPIARRCCVSAPNIRCQCGIYGVFDREEVHHYGMTRRVANALDVECTLDVIGQFSAWGRIVECELGCKVQFGYPYALQVIRPFALANQAQQQRAWDKSRVVAAELRKHYCVDVEVA